jgi:hypothetical protein
MSGDATGDAPPDGSPPELDHRRLRSALEFAVLMAQEGAKHRPPLPAPAELRTYFNTPRLTNAALRRVRRAVEADDTFRRRLAAGALPELVDEVGRLWLLRPEGWQEQVRTLLAQADEAEQEEDLRRAARRADKRRLAAEQAAARAATAVDAQRAEADGLRGELAEARERIGGLESELEAARRELREANTAARHERDRLLARIERLERDRPEPVATAPPDQAVGEAQAELRREVDELRGLLVATRRALTELADDLVDPVPAPTGEEGGASRRVPVRLPGGVLASSVEAARFLVRSGAIVLVDGYNVTKTGWADLALRDQRERLVRRVEDLSNRYGSELVVVFDGAAVEGAHTPARRAVKVVFSPPDRTADDEIRALVAQIPPDRAVVVVTSDAEIVRDVRAMGANAVPSTAFFALL